MELRQGGVTDTAVLRALETVPREAFVEPAQAPAAFDNRALPIACGQTISQPLIVGLMTQALRVGDRDKVLEVGTGSGYQAAVLSRLGRRVYTIERHRALHRTATDRLAALGYGNVTTLLGDGWKGWPDQAPFDRIMVTAAARDIPDALVDQLKVGGVMVIPVGAVHETQDLLCLYKTPERVEVEVLCAVRFVPLVPGLAAGGGR
jgi:protein-L-isoaspartate(D-aspartate) O-methyltransferase